MIEMIIFYITGFVTGGYFSALLVVNLYEKKENKKNELTKPKRNA